MAQSEEVELEAHQAQLRSDLRHLVDKYRAVFGWNVAAVDDAFSERLVITSLRSALADLQQQLPRGPRS